MKIRILFLKNIFLSVLLVICHQQTCVAQENATDKSRSSSHIFIGLNLIPSLSKIDSKTVSSISSVVTNRKNTFSGSLEFGYTFSKRVGITTGLGLSSYGSSLSLDSCYIVNKLTDSENDTYEHRVKGSGIIEEQKISFLNIPFCFTFQIPVTHRAGFFINPGFNISLPVGKTYDSNGTFTYTAYYTAYNVLMKDVPSYGLLTKAKVASSGNLELKSISIFATVSAGFQYFVSSKIQLGLGINYNRSLSDISNYSSTADSFEISPNPNLINTLMGGSEGTTAQAIGLNISFRYYIR